MKGNNEDSFVYSGPISSARRTKIYVNFAHQTHNLCAIKNIIKACQKLQFVNKYTLGTFLFFLDENACLFALFDSLRPSKHVFSYVGIVLHGLNQ